MIGECCDLVSVVSVHHSLTTCLKGHRARGGSVVVFSANVTCEMTQDLQGEKIFCGCFSFRKHSGRTMDFSDLTVPKLREALKQEGVEVKFYSSEKK